ncbi:hypothetical protein D3C71_1319110 [compost metagenome]
MALGRREQLDARRIAPTLADFRLHLEQGVLARAVGQLVGLGQQDVHRHAAGLGPVEHHLVEVGHRVAHIHHQDHATQALPAAQVGFQVFLPVLLERNRDFCITVARQVDQTPFIVQTEEIQQLGAPGSFRGTRQAGMSQGVEGAGFAGVGTAGESHLVTLVVRALFDLGSAEGEFGFLAEAEDGVLDLHGISDVGVA